MKQSCEGLPLRSQVSIPSAEAKVDGRRKETRVVPTSYMNIWNRHQQGGALAGDEMVDHVTRLHRNSFPANLGHRCCPV